MKRLLQTLTAPALTGALAFGGAAVAQAKEVTQHNLLGGEVIYESDQGFTTVKERALQEDAEFNELEQADSEKLKARLQSDKEERAALNVEDTPQFRINSENDESIRLNPNEAEGDQPNGEQGETQEDKLEVPSYDLTGDGPIYLHPSGVWVGSLEAAQQETLTDEQKARGEELSALIEKDQTFRKDMGQEVPAVPTVDGEEFTEGVEGFDEKKLAWLALSAALVIGGITWYLSQDGKTYVKDEARKHQEPTAEEKAASEQMLNANKDEVIAQGGQLAEGDAAQADAPSAPATGESADSARGMSAETGSNSVAQALAALAVAAMVAAGAFAARREFFA